MAKRPPITGLPFPKKVTRPRAANPDRDEAHLRLLRKCQCLACGAEPAEAAHIRYSDAARGKVNPGMGRKPADRHAVPLCPKCHRMGRGCQHDRNERVWWEQHRIDPLVVADALYSASTVGRNRRLETSMLVDLLRAVVRKSSNFGTGGTNGLWKTNLIL